MKLRFLSLMMLASFTLFACEEEPKPQDDNKPDTSVEGTITLASSADIVFPETGGSSQVAFSATKAWTASVSADWLDVEPKSGEPGKDLTVTVTSRANATTDKLTATLTLNCEKDSKTVKVILTEASETPDTPDTPTSWPNDEDAFDYGLEKGATRKASLASDLFSAYGVSASSRNIQSPVLIDGITYGGPGLAYYGNRVTMDKVASQWSEEYPDVIPSQCYISFKINQPGTLTFYGAPLSGADRIPTYYLAVVTKVGGKTSARIVTEYTPTEIANGQDSANRTDANIYSEAWQKYWISMSITEDDIKGIEEAATVYFFHRNSTVNTLSVGYWPLEWTLDGEGSVNPSRKPKFLLAGDSTCTKYSDASRPQAGWGEFLAEALGNDPQVSNHAVGGESTKSFIDSGKWKSLRASILSRDIVLIQFGHNDEKTDDAHATDPYTTYQENLKTMIDETREKGGVPVLVTSICRLGFQSNGDPVRSHGEYPKAMRQLAESTSTPLIDAEELTWQWLKELGSIDAASKYFVLDKRDSSANDKTHLTIEGAKVVAGMIAKGIKDLGLWE